MDAVKKILILFFGLFVVAAFGWIVFQATDPGGAALSTTRLTPRPLENPLRQIDPPSPEGSHAEPGEAREIPEKVVEVIPPSSRIQRDSISWKPALRKDNTAPNPENPVIAGRIPPVAGNPNNLFVSAANRILPAVVSIRSSRRISGNWFDSLHPFLFDNDEEEEQDGDSQEENPHGEGDIYQPGSGSGIVVSPEGHIMTNYHVVEDADNIRVMLYDKREYDAKLIGHDPTTDVALIKIEGENIPAAVFGNSDAVQIGEWVMAVGNPLNFTSTVTSGIVSAIGRNINIIDRRYRYRIENFIQTDAVINPGNSGGALINLDGEVIGMNTAIATRNGFYQGYGFAIPVNLARKVVDDLALYGRVRRGILGVVIEPVDDGVARGLGLDKPSGALVQGVSPRSAAENAGLRQGDIILKVDDREVLSVNDLQIKIAAHHPGETVTLTIWRKNKSYEVDVVLGEAPSGNNTAQNNREKPAVFRHLGIKTRELSEKEKSGFDIEQGLVVESLLRFTSRWILLLPLHAR